MVFLINAASIFLVLAWVLVIVQGGVLVVDAVLMHALVQPVVGRFQSGPELLVAQCIRAWGQGVDIGLYLNCIFVGVDAKVAEVAAFPTKRNVQVQSKRHVSWIG